MKDGNGKIYNLEYEISKGEFLKAIEPILYHGRNFLSKTLQEAELSIDEVSRISLVGDTSKSDWVKDSIMKLYPSGKERTPYMATNFETVVSQGAAAYGALVG